MGGSDSAPLTEDILFSAALPPKLWGQTTSRLCGLESKRWNKKKGHAWVARERMGEKCIRESREETDVPCGQGVVTMTTNMPIWNLGPVYKAYE